MLLSRVKCGRPADIDRLRPHACPRYTQSFKIINPEERRGARKPREEVRKFVSSAAQADVVKINVPREFVPLVNNTNVKERSMIVMFYHRPQLVSA